MYRMSCVVVSPWKLSLLFNYYEGSIVICCDITAYGNWFAECINIVEQKAKLTRKGGKNAAYDPPGIAVSPPSCQWQYRSVSWLGYLLVEADLHGSWYPVIPNSADEDPCVWKNEKKCGVLHFGGNYALDHCWLMWSLIGNRIRRIKRYHMRGLRRAKVSK